MIPQARINGDAPVTPFPCADSPSSPAFNETEVHRLLPGLGDPTTADALARLLLPWVEHEIEMLRRNRNLPAMEVADAVQEILLALLRALPSFDAREPGKLQTFLGVVVRRRFSNFCRND